MREILARDGQELELGRRGENKAVCICFDISAWVKTYGNGQITLIHQRNGDKIPYPVDTKMELSRVLWEVSNADTEKAGKGRAELQYWVGETLAKSAIYSTRVAQAMGTASEEAPEPANAWLETLTQLGSDIKANAETAANSIAATAENAARAQEAQNKAESAASRAENAAGQAMEEAEANLSGYVDDAKAAAQRAEKAAEIATNAGEAALDEAREQLSVLVGEVEAVAAEASESAEAAAASEIAAKNSATSAQSSASKAESAQSKAESAQSKAEAAQAKAETAKAGAEAAISSTASNAQAAASSASEAQSAKADAQTAKQGAEKAASNAQSYASAAESSKNGAKASENAAKNAEAGAEAAKAAAERARDEAEQLAGGDFATVHLCYYDETYFDEVNEWYMNGDIIMLWNNYELWPLVYAEEDVQYKFRIVNGEAVMTATLDYEGWSGSEDEPGGTQEYAPIDHAVNDTTYGKGTIAQYGHVKLSDAMDSYDGSTSGIAATPLAVKTAYDKAKEAANAAASHTQAASTITAGTFAGQVVANASGQAAGTSLLRNSKLVSSDTNPTVNGEIFWTYK